MSRCNFRYFTKEQLEKESPSRKDGLEYRKEKRFSKTCYEYIRDTAKALKMPQLSVATASVLFHRYFAVRSMLRTDRFLLATAALFLAGKIEETPKALRDVIWMFFKYRFRKNKEMLAKFNDKRVYEEVMETVLLLERLLLCVLGFDFNIQHPYPTLLKLWSGNKYLQHLHLTRKEETAKSGLQEMSYIQLSWNLVNDSYATQMCLLYEPPLVAAAAVKALLTLTSERQEMDDGAPWWADSGTRAVLGQDYSQEQLEDVSQQLLDYYNWKPQGTATEATNTQATAAPSVANSNSGAAGATEGGAEGPESGRQAKRQRVGGPDTRSGGEDVDSGDAATTTVTGNSLAAGCAAAAADGQPPAPVPEDGHAASGQRQASAGALPTEAGPAAAGGCAAANSTEAAPVMQRMDTVEEGEIEPGEVVA